ncbi:hypothetical protein BC937DRAFT_91545 [Endogone sp. FLAS-F59071]|nr:hypothetical protein BC937DRAFT_91545 [Endogone sp. FLAS-F59071]|eukprot:RUS16171.1 hypothetical protein BC937DRAFT_91545 [Endogone sp. FLAS-F59071]
MLRKLICRLEELESEAHKRPSARQAHRNEHTIRDLQFQLAERDKARTHHDESSIAKSKWSRQCSNRSMKWYANISKYWKPDLIVWSARRFF